MRHLLLSLLVVFASNPLNAQRAGMPDDGNVKDGVYVNRFFGFSFTYPKGWTVHGAATDEVIRETGKQRVTGSGALTEGQLDVLLKRTYTLLTVFQHPVGTPGIVENSGIQVLAEDVRHAPGITDGRTYLQYVRPLFLKMGARFSQEQPVEVTIGGRQFLRTDYDLETNKVFIHQAMIIGFDKGHIFGFVFTSKDQATVDQFTRSLNTVIFKKTALRAFD